MGKQDKQERCVGWSGAGTELVDDQSAMKLEKEHNKHVVTVSFRVQDFAYDFNHIVIIRSGVRSDVACTSLRREVSSSKRAFW